MAFHQEVEAALRYVVQRFRSLDAATGVLRRTNVSVWDCERLLDAAEWDLAIELLAEMYFEMLDEGVGADGEIQKTLTACASKLSLPDPFSESDQSGGGSTYNDLLAEYRGLSANRTHVEFAQVLKDQGIEMLTAVRMLREIYGLDLDEATKCFR